MIWSCSKCPGSFFEEENSSRAVHQRANTSQRLGRPQHQPTWIGPRVQLQHPAAAPLVQDGHYGC